jgi:6-pyruvoyl-tetrahydropterin synthase
LAGVETPHFHLWKVEAVFSSQWPLTGDRLIDLVFLQNTLDRVFTGIDGAHLNEALPFSPTSENLTEWIWKRLREELPEAPLSEVAVSLCDLTGKVSGRARLRA